MVNDPVADFVVQIKNAGMVGKSEISVSYSAMKEAIAAVLEQKGFIESFEVSGEGAKKVIVVTLAKKERGPAVEGVRRVSKPSRRLYVRANEIKKVKGGRGVLVVTTPQGVMDGESARNANVGGEILFEIW